MFSDITHNLVGIYFQNIEVDGLAKGSALSNHDNITHFNCESWGAVNCNVPVSFFVSVVFGDIMEIVPTNNKGPLHFVTDDNTLKNLTPDGNIAGKWTFLVNILGFDSLFGSFESQSNILIIPNTRTRLLGEKFLAVEEHIFLFLEGSFVLKIKKYVLGYQPSITTDLF